MIGLRNSPSEVVSGSPVDCTTSALPLNTRLNPLLKLVRELQDLIGPKMDEKKGQISQIVKDLLKKAQED